MHPSRGQRLRRRLPVLCPRCGEVRTLNSLPGHYKDVHAGLWPGEVARDLSRIRARLRLLF